MTEMYRGWTMKLKNWPMLEVSHLYAWRPIFRVKHGWISDGLSSNIMTILMLKPCICMIMHEHTQQDL